MLHLKSLNIQRTYYFSSDPKQFAKLEAVVEFINDERTQTQLRLTPEQTHRILAVVADALVASTREVVQALTAEVIQQAGTPLLEG